MINIEGAITGIFPILGDVVITFFPWFFIGRILEDQIAQQKLVAAAVSKFLRVSVYEH